MYPSGAGGVSGKPPSGNTLDGVGGSTGSAGLAGCAAGAGSVGGAGGCAQAGFRPPDPIRTARANETKAPAASTPARNVMGHSLASADPWSPASPSSTQYPRESMQPLLPL